MKRPSDTHIRLWRTLIGALVILTGIVAFKVQWLMLQDSILGITLNETNKEYVKHAMVMIGLIPLIGGAFDINLLSRGRARILQIVFAIVLLIMAGAFIESPTVGINILYFFLGLFVLGFWITGKGITKKGLKTGQKITKIRV